MIGKSNKRNDITIINTPALMFDSVGALPSYSGRTFAAQDYAYLHKFSNHVVLL